MELQKFMFLLKFKSNPQDKMQAIADFISEHFDELEDEQFVKLLTVFVDTARGEWEANKRVEDLTEYTFGMAKLGEYLQRCNRSWECTPLTDEMCRLLTVLPDTDKTREWKRDTWQQVGSLFAADERRQAALDAYRQAKSYTHADDEALEDIDCNIGDLEQRLSGQEHHLRYDPVEDSEAYLAVKDEVERELYNIFKDTPRGMGFCFGYWREKQRLLEKKYGISWRTPSQMNPRVVFD